MSSTSPPRRPKGASSKARGERSQRFVGRTHHPRPDRWGLVSLNLAAASCTTRRTPSERVSSTFSRRRPHDGVRVSYAGPAPVPCAHRARQSNPALLQQRTDGASPTPTSRLVNSLPDGPASLLLGFIMSDAAAAIENAPSHARRSERVGPCPRLLPVPPHTASPRSRRRRPEASNDAADLTAFTPARGKGRSEQPRPRIGRALLT